MIRFVKNYFPLLVPVVLYLLYSYFILVPSDYKSFSLIDDGQTIVNTMSLSKCFKLGECEASKEVFIEKEYGRFRPVYWTINYLLFDSIKLNPVLHHQFRIYIVGTICVIILGLILNKLKTNTISIVVASLFFFISYSFSENFIRLGPTEPFQLISVALLSYFLFNLKRRKWLFILITYILAVLIKETSVVILVPILFYSHFISNNKVDIRISWWLLTFGLFAFAFSRFISTPLESSIAYTDNYKLSIDLLINNFLQYYHIILNSTSPFLKSFIVVCTFTYLFFKKSIFKNKYLLYWLIVFCVFVGILVPWKYVLERYLLVPLFSFSAIIGIVITQIYTDVASYLENYKHNKRYKVLSMMLKLTLCYMIINMFFLNFPINYAKTVNYRDWYSVFLKYEFDQVNAIVNIGVPKVYINAKDTIDNWEVLYELPIHVNVLNMSDTQIERIGNTLPKNGYIMTRQPFDVLYSDDEILSSGYISIFEKKYTISQIDPIYFRDKFVYRPLSTIINPPLIEKPYSYSFAIYNKN